MKPIQKDSFKKVDIYLCFLNYHFLLIPLNKLKKKGYWFGFVPNSLLVVGPLHFFSNLPYWSQIAFWPLIDWSFQVLGNEVLNTTSSRKQDPQEQKKLSKLLRIVPMLTIGNTYSIHYSVLSTYKTLQVLFKIFH